MAVAFRVMARPSQLQKVRGACVRSSPPEIAVNQHSGQGRGPSRSSSDLWEKRGSSGAVVDFPGVKATPQRVQQRLTFLWETAPSLEEPQSQGALCWLAAGERRSGPEAQRPKVTARTSFPCLRKLEMLRNPLWTAL